MATAITFNGYTIKGVVLEGAEFSPRLLQFHDRKFWGVSGVSRTYGGFGPADILAPVIIYDSSNVDFNTARKLSDYIDTTLKNTFAGMNGSLLVTSESDHATFLDCTFEGALPVEGPKKDEA